MQLIFTPAARLAAIKAALDLLPENQRHMPTALAEIDALQAALRSQPEPLSEGDIAQRIADADADELPALLDQLDAEKRRSDLLSAATAGGLNARIQTRQSHAVFEAIPELLDRLRPVFDTAVKNLQRAAAKLPAGAAALDPAAVLDADASSPYHAARDALATLERITDAIPVILRHDGTTPPGTRAVTVLDVPSAGPLLWDGITEGDLNDPDDAEHCHALARLVRDYADDARLTLLDVTRGHYRDVTFRLASSREQLDERVQRVATAHTRRRVDSPTERARRDAKVWKSAG